MTIKLARKLYLPVFTISLILSNGCSQKSHLASDSGIGKGLKDYYKAYFPIGVAVSTASLHGVDSALIVKEFNSVTPENDMKMGPLHPSEDVYNWKNADDIVNFAVAHHIKIRGHNLCWHAQEANWMFTGPDGKQVSKELLLKRLKDHIFAVAGRYKGKIYAWDVVNEAVDDSNDTTQVYRKSNWYTICNGPEFIEAAFRYAHEADPGAKLYYNDYNSEHPIKREKIYKLLKRLVDNHVPIDGVGMQAHWKLNDPSPEELRKALDEFTSLGLKIQITELDITIRMPRPRPAPGSIPAAQVPDSGYTPQAEARQVAQYKMAFDIFREYRKSITSVTFWNVSDRYSWLDARGGGLAGGAAASNNGPRVIRKAYPLLFDENRQRKKAYQAVIDF
ncbi:1,4-beta-xylanase [Mucilaginibacter sp. PPCGB 2223]|uniref:endo-1,4-beta-xylanase n=1 Tax=Mucilaginibacter sp. PPCGB 2223 TaxID=1886027 RepID=UPI0008249D9C|nr:endo-1,4-beta-xylanase [Mucilaginibacter sp. PPCGB 2223]OCX53008.1 1,4-beta-xylanase [Mucilaginibacter sp. PPCGB 2223]